MKIGVLGGSFDPPHKGHLKIAREAEKRLALDMILFVPCQSHTLKGHMPAASPFHRSAMTALATSGKESWLVEPVELERGGISYTVETLMFLQKKYKRAELFFLMGEDSYKDFPRWKNPEGIRKLAKLVVFPRGDHGTAIVRSGELLMDTAKIEISSETIRNMAASGKSTRALLTKGVWEYIQKHSLYVINKEV
jgi:nicotinate-nucleotide adenylyltransferase